MWRLILAILFLVLAIAPWFIGGIVGPLIPPQLPATRTIYAIVVSTRSVATATARAQSARKQDLVLGIAARDLSIYRCPGEAYRSTAKVPQDASIRILGWNEDANGVVWFLTKDDPDKAQEWIHFDANIKLTPSNFKTYFPEPVSCR